MEGDTFNRRSVSFEQTNQLTAIQIPQPDVAIPAAASQRRPIGMESEGDNPIMMAMQSRADLAGLPVPDSNSLIESPAHNHAVLACASSDRCCCYGSHMALQPEQQSTAVNIP